MLDQIAATLTAALIAKQDGGTVESAVNLYHAVRQELERKESKKPKINPANVVGLP